MIFSEIFKQTFQAKNWKWILSVVGYCKRFSSNINCLLNKK